MTRDPIRAFRVQDQLWESALRLAHEDKISLSSVLRGALRDYVDRPRSSARGDTAPLDHLSSAPETGVGDEQSLLTDGWAVVAKAQGVLMARHRCDHAQAMALLRHLALTGGQEVPDAAARVVLDLQALHRSGVDEEVAIDDEIYGSHTDR